MQYIANVQLSVSREFSQSKFKPSHQPFTPAFHTILGKPTDFSFVRYGHSQTFHSLWKTCFVTAVQFCNSLEIRRLSPDSVLHTYLLSHGSHSMPCPVLNPMLSIQSLPSLADCTGAWRLWHKQASSSLELYSWSWLP